MVISPRRKQVSADGSVCGTCVADAFVCPFRGFHEYSRAEGPWRQAEALLGDTRIPAAFLGLRPTLA
jgi:hypothetical protein